MTDLDFFNKVVCLRKLDQPAALATAIRTRGSTPRKTGTKMLIYLNGQIEGTIGGGCGEAEVIEEAYNVIRKKLPTHYTVDLTSGILYEDGGICGGTMDVFIEPICKEG
ncbi:XdhC family protein [Alteribacter populi]|uniref:XdhC family protein n=1 Tax=Alteribacter populi TaxID=2011011 RepID=UPI000BBA7A3B|nr:XdhC family protein [Alteribacter populi]